MTDAFDFLGDGIHSISMAASPSNGSSLAHTKNAPSQEDAAFSAAISVWQGIQLPAVQQDMDERSVELLESQQQSLAGRKKLAELTREFKKVPDDEKLQQFKLLLKAYQGEIDAITKREKATSQAFLKVYNTLGQAPDPTRLLKVAVDQTSKISELSPLQEENTRLREEIASLNKQTVNFKSAASNATKLQLKLSRLETKQEELVQEKVKEKEQAFREEWEERIRNAKEREHDLQRQLNQAKDQLRLLKSTNDSTQATLVDHSQKYEEEVVAKLAELDIVLIDFERANGRIAEVEEQNELLRQQLDNMQGRGADADRVTTLEQRIESQDSELSAIVQRMETSKVEYRQQVSTLERKVAEYSRDIQAKNQELELTRRQMEKYKDYDTVKNELDVLKYIEFSSSRGTVDDDDWDEQVLTLASKNLEKPIEVLLLEKSRKLENELTELKVRHEDVQIKLLDTETRFTTAAKQLSSQTTLIHRLEEDITRLNQQGPGSTANGVILPSSPSFGQLSFGSDTVGGITLGPILPGTPRAQGIPTSIHGQMSSYPGSSEASNIMTTPPPVPTTSSADHSILPIVTSQRDRFRQRNSELEEQLRQQSEQISALRNDTSSLQKDNVKLYEKIKYMQTYRSSEPTDLDASSQMVDYSTPFRSQPGGSQKGVTGRGQYKKDDGDEIQLQVQDSLASNVTDRYRNIYEESMNPFEAFHKKEESRRYNDMNTADKAMLTMSRLVLTNKWTRSMLIAYSLGLHFLMVVILYRMSLWEDCVHDHETPNDANPVLPAE